MPAVMWCPAQAAVASKITGGSFPDGGRGQSDQARQIIARLENDDTLASRDQALANQKVAEANLAEARRSEHRHFDLWPE